MKNQTLPSGLKEPEQSVRLETDGHRPWGNLWMHIDL